MPNPHDGTNLRLLVEWLRERRRQGPFRDRDQEHGRRETIRLMEESLKRRG